MDWWEKVLRHNLVIVNQFDIVCVSSEPAKANPLRPLSARVPFLLPRWLNVICLTSLAENQTIRHSYEWDSNELPTDGVVHDA